MRGQGAIDRRIATLAGGQHGIVSRAQLRGLGLSADAVDRRLGRGRLHLVHRGVYAVGHPVLTIEGRWMAATFAGGTDAVLSHSSAAAAWDLRRVGAGAIHVTVPGTPGRKRRTDLRVHRSATLEQDETTTLRCIPITTPVRTIIDLATMLTGRPLEHVLDHAEQLRLIDFAELERCLAAHPTRPGSPSLRAMLCRYTAGSTVTRSEMEERFLHLCDDHGLPRPTVNTRVEGVEVDFAWRDACLIVEVDGYRYHRSPSMFESDRERDVMLVLAGWQVLRFTWTELTSRSAWVAQAIADCLAR
jgi:hypothetical protein